MHLTIQENLYLAIIRSCNYVRIHYRVLVVVGGAIQVYVSQIYLAHVNDIVEVKSEVLCGGAAIDSE